MKILLSIAWRCPKCPDVFLHIFCPNAPHWLHARFFTYWNPYRASCNHASSISVHPHAIIPYLWTKMVSMMQGITEHTTCQHRYVSRLDTSYSYCHRNLYMGVWGSINQLEYWVQQNTWMSLRIRESHSRNRSTMFNKHWRWQERQHSFRHTMSSSKSMNEIIVTTQVSWLLSNHGLFLFHLLKLVLFLLSIWGRNNFQK